MLTGNQIREKFLTYFESKTHTRVSSASLIPHNDPTLFFVNAGMVQFKDVFTGQENKDYKRATTSQKCMRVSGKHNDLENVGRTPRHHTFFEMLGNFSFGDYFKKEAIEFGWEFLTEVVQLPAECLWITIFQDDDEAYDLWANHMKIPANKIVRCGEKDNFWSMGPTGPCGPCSEIHIDLGHYRNNQPSAGDPITHEEDFMEIWNLVFMQFDRDESGKMTPLPSPSIDTGMGLERLAAVLQKKQTNYDTDLFQPLIQAIATRTQKQYGSDDETDVSLRVIADHIRAATFLISDGVQPSNEGRGYVLRRIMRRAIRHGRLLGMSEPFFHEIVAPLVSEMQDAYPDLKSNQQFIEKVVLTEEQRFLETLDNGLKMIDEEIATLQKAGTQVFSGEVAFKLYDTFGFPIDLTQLIAEEKGLSVDMKVFDEQMAEQKQRARAAWKGSGQEKVGEVYHQLVSEGKTTDFVGYETLEAESTLVALLVDGVLVNEITEGQKGEAFVSQTPFYGESGGQVGDGGSINAQSGHLQVKDTLKPLDGLFSHHVVATQGKVKVGDTVTLQVDNNLRRPTMLNHTATHILHAALRKTLGDHVKQAGSLVDAEKLRFDFSHFEAVSAQQLRQLEDQVNQVIQSNLTVTKEEMSQEEAKSKGALAFFGDKYGDRVRVVGIGDYSVEFCGGTHLDAAGEIGAFKITSESSVAAGVRRIEAITGMTAIAEFQNLKQQLDILAAVLKASPSEMVAKLKKLNTKVKDLEKDIKNLQTKLASGGAGGGDATDNIKEVKGVKLLTLETNVSDAKALRELSDQLKNKIGSGLVVIGSQADGKAILLIAVTKDLTKKYHAGQLIKELAPLIGGKGGGRPDMAQAGGSQPEKLAQVFEKVEQLI